MAFRTIEVTLKATTAAFTAQMGVAANSVKEFQSDIAKAAAANERFVQGMGKASLVASGALAAGLGLSTRAAIGWESAFAGVEKTVNGTQAELAALSDGIREMSKDLPASAVEIASVAEAAGQLGIETGSILSFARTMVDLGETTNLTATEAATSLARLANIMGTSSSDFDRLGSTIVDLGNNSETTEAEIVEFSQRLAAAGAIANLSEADVLAFAATLTSVGVDAEAGGTALSKVFTAIRDATLDGGEALDTFAKVVGTTAEQFVTSFQDDPAMAIESFIAGLGRMNAAGQSTSSVFDDLGLADERLKRALLSTAEAGDHLSDRILMSNAAWEANTALQTEAEQRYATTAAQLEILRNKVTDLGVDAGNVLLPAFNSVVEAAGNMADGLASLPAPLTTAATGFAAFASASLGLVGTTILLAPKIKQFKDGVEDMGSIAQFTGRHLRGLTLGVAGIGVAVGAGVLIYEAASRSAREYDEAVKELTGTFTEAREGQLGLNFVMEEFFDKMASELGTDNLASLDEVGVKFADLEEAIRGGGDVLDPLRDKLAGLGIEIEGLDFSTLTKEDIQANWGALNEELDRLGSSLSANDLLPLIDALEDYDNAAQDAARGDLQQAKAKGDLTQAQIDSAVETLGLTVASENYVAVFDKLFPKTKQAESATSSYASATEDMADAAEKAAQALQDLIDAYSAPLTPIFAMQDAMRGVEDANKAVRDSEKAFVDAQRDVIDANEAVADAHRGVAEAQRNAQRNVASAQRDAVKAAAEIEDAQIEVAKAMSMVADEAEAARRGVADLAAEQQAAVDPLFGMLDALEKQQQLLGQVSDTAAGSGGRGFVPGEFEVTVSDMKEAMAGPGGRLEGNRTGSSGPSAADIAKGAADVTRAAIRLAGAIQNGEVSLDDSRAMLNRWVEQGLITADQAKTVAAQFENAAKKAEQLQGANVRGAISSSVQAERMRVEAERTEAVAAAQQKVVEATERAAAAQERVAEAAAEGAEAIEAAQERVVDAVAAAADAKDNLADAADDMRDAQDRAARSQFELMIASIGLAGAIKNNAGLLNDAKQRIREMGRAAGLSEGEIDRLERQIDDAARAAQEWARPYVAKFGLDTEDFWRELANARFALAMTQLEQQQGGARTPGLQVSTGGYITGADREPIYRATGGPSGTDTIPAWLSPGEYVVQAAAVNALGLDTMHRINRAGSFPDARLPDARGAGMSVGTTTGAAFDYERLARLLGDRQLNVNVPPGVVEDERDLGRELHSALFTAGIT